MAFNPAVYATRLNSENRTEATRIILANAYQSYLLDEPQNRCYTSSPKLSQRAD